jgi:hypothetical protein
MMFLCLACTVRRLTNAPVELHRLALLNLRLSPARMTRLLIAAAFVVVTATAAGQFAPSPTQPTYASLTTNQRASVERGEPVQVLEPLSTSPWPRSVVFQFIEATPEECAAMLSDYELQAKYIPRMKTSRILRRRSPIETDVQYVIDVPVYPDERSVSRQQVSTANGDYAVRWQTVVSDSAQRGSVTSGRASFAMMTNFRSGKAGTLMVHDQTVIPSSMFARVPYVRNKAIETSRDAAQAIARQIEKERSGDPRLLERQVVQLRQALAWRPDSAQLH